MPPLTKRLETYTQSMGIVMMTLGGVYVLCALTGWFSNPGILLTFGIGSILVTVWIKHSPSVKASTIRNLERGNYLIDWQFSRAEQAEARQLVRKTKEFEAIPDWMVYAVVSCLALAPLVGRIGEKFEMPWVMVPFIVLGTLGLAGLWFVLKRRAANRPNEIVDRAIISLTHMHWRKRLFTFEPNVEENLMRLERVGRRIFFVAVTRHYSDGEVTYRDVWIPVPTGEERTARRVMNQIYENAAASEDREVVND